MHFVIISPFTGKKHMLFLVSGMNFVLLFLVSGMKFMSIFLLSGMEFMSLFSLSGIDFMLIFLVVTMERVLMVCTRDPFELFDHRRQTVVSVH